MKDRALLVAVGVLITLSAVVNGWLILRAQTESRWNREVLCIGILGNETNTARIDPRVTELCASVNVQREKP